MGIVDCYVVPHGTLGCNKGGVIGVFLESVQLWVVLYCHAPGCARPRLCIGTDIYGCKWITI
jgi:hypothetical protein